VERWGKFKADDIRPKHLLAMRDSLADTPTTANHLVSIVKTLWQWGIPREYATINPARELKPIKVEREGAKPWPAWALKLIGERARWEVRTAVALGLYTGQRMADVVAMSMRDVTGDRIAVVQSKTNKRLTLPVHQSLAPVIEACRKRGVSNLVPRPGGEAHNAEQFQALWQREMAKDWAAPLRAAKLSFHGLRKSAATTLKEIGATDAQIQSVTGMSKPMVELYTRHMDQEALALSAVQLWEASGR
jgi:integrase